MNEARGFWRKIGLDLEVDSLAIEPLSRLSNAENKKIWIDF
jgi:hypothetical protein